MLRYLEKYLENLWVLYVLRQISIGTTVRILFNSVNLLLHFVCLFRQKRAEIPYNSSQKYDAKKLLHLSMQEHFGAATQIRTGDLILTKDALYLLSYSSKLYAPLEGAYSVATEKGLEPSTSSVTG